MDNERSSQDTCPICLETFQEADILVWYTLWNRHSIDRRLGHGTCVLALVTPASPKRMHD